jgi:hypothetical protein
MTPATINPDDMPIYKGAQWSHTFTFKQRGTTDPVDLTGLGPFVITLKRTNNDTVVAQAAVAFVGDPELGQITGSLTAAQTDPLPIGNLRIGMRDAFNNPYAEGLVAVKPFTPDPA